MHTKDQTYINNVISLSASGQWYVLLFNGTSGPSIIEHKFHLTSITSMCIHGSFIDNDHCLVHRETTKLIRTFIFSSTAYLRNDTNCIQNKMNDDHQSKNFTF